MRHALRHAQSSLVQYVDVSVDDAGRLGVLSYRVPPDVPVGVGDAVLVPFGKLQRTGVVVGPSPDPSKASRALISRLGRQLDGVDVEAARALASRLGVGVGAVAASFRPRWSRSGSAAPAEPLVLAPKVPRRLASPPARNWLRRLYIRAPLVDPAQLAALEAYRLSGERGGAVLVLCPSTALLESVLACFSSGAVRLDSKAPAGAWLSFSSGSALVGVGSRASMWASPEKLSGIVVVEEDLSGHRDLASPFLHARDVAAERAQAHGCALSLISVNPSLSALSSRVKVVGVGAQRHWPSVLLIDRTEFAPHEREFPPLARGRLDRFASRGVDPVLVARSSPRRVCRGCGQQVGPCSCSQAQCAHPLVDPCSRCGDVRAVWLGWSRERAAQVLPGLDVSPLSSLVPRPSSPRVVVLPDADWVPSRSLLPEHDAAGVLMRAAEAAGMSGSVMLLASGRSDPLRLRFAARDQVGMSKLVWDAAVSRGLGLGVRQFLVSFERKSAPKVEHWPGRVLGPRRTEDGWEVLLLSSPEQEAEVGEFLRSLRRSSKAKVVLL